MDNENYEGKSLLIYIANKDSFFELYYWNSVNKKKKLFNTERVVNPVKFSGSIHRIDA